MQDHLSPCIPTPAQMKAVGAAFMRALEWERAEHRREVAWRRKQLNDIGRQLLDRDPTYFGRKRRARRARGKWNMAAQPYLGGHIWLADCHELDALAYLRQGQRLHQALQEEQRDA